MTEIERFWAKVDKLGPIVRPELGPCWVWTAGLTGDGYGAFGWGPKCRTGRAHRFAWEIANGSIPKGLCVLHRCDNPKCVRADHLFVGTSADNTRDRHAKGRTARGDMSGARLHPETRPRGDAHWSRRHPEMVPHIKRRPETVLRGEAHGRAKLTERDVLAIRARRARGETLVSIAADYGVSHVRISMIALRKTWRHVA